MEDHLKEIQKSQKDAARISSVSLIVSMLIMAIWGWTPLKNMIPAVYVLLVFSLFVVVAIISAGFSIYKGIQGRAQKALIEDQ